MNFARFVSNPTLRETNILLEDSFTGQRDQSIFVDNCPGKTIQIMTIPPKTTKYIQALDVYFFRQMKILLRRITDYARSALPQDQLEVTIFHFDPEISS